MDRQRFYNLVWACISACVALGALLVYVVLGHRAPHPAGGGVAGYALGIGSLVLVGVATAYWGRGRHVPRTWREPVEGVAERPTGALAETREKLADLQAEGARGEGVSIWSMRLRAKRIVKAAGLRSTYRVVVRRDAEGRSYIRMDPKEPLNALSNWLLGHQYLGGVALLLAGLHCGFKVGSAVGAAALGLLAAVVVSGVVGTVIYSVAARRLTAVEARLREGQGGDPSLYAAVRARWESALKVWLYAHTPLTVAMLVIVVAHVAAVLYY